MLLVALQNFYNAGVVTPTTSYSMKNARVVAVNSKVVIFGISRGGSQLLRGLLGGV
jgi:hypothetical protein